MSPASMWLPSKLEAMLDALEANGWLGGIDAVLTGYLPTVSHVEFARKLVARVRSRQPAAIFFCDPVMGDLPRGLYIDDAPAQMITERLMEKADYLTPNLFELQWLSDAPVADIASAVKAARSLPAPVTLVTSVPAWRRSDRQPARDRAAGMDLRKPRGSMPYRTAPAISWRRCSRPNACPGGTCPLRSARRRPPCRSWSRTAWAATSSLSCRLRTRGRSAPSIPVTEV